MKENNTLAVVKRHNESCIFSLLHFFPLSKTDYCIIWHILIFCKYLNWFTLICIVEFALRMHCGTETVLNAANNFWFILLLCTWGQYWKGKPTNKGINMRLNYLCCHLKVYIFVSFRRTFQAPFCLFQIFLLNIWHVIIANFIVLSECHGKMCLLLTPCHVLYTFCFRLFVKGQSSHYQNGVICIVNFVWLFS